MAIAQVAIQKARAFLNDNNGISWTDSILLPLLGVAHSELIQDLDLNSVGVLMYQTPVITVPFGSTDLGSNQPANILDPIAMQEKSPGASNDFFVDMLKVGFLPEMVPINYLTWWAWSGELIQFVGSTATREVILRYKGFLTTPQTLNDPIGVTFGENFLGPRIAALCYDIAGKNSTVLNATAQQAKYKLLQRGVLSDQRPVRRRGYRDPKSSYPGRYSVPVGVTPGGGAVTWYPTSTPPDGIRTTFIFPIRPRYISWNGMNQFEGSGYTMAVVSGVYTVTFKDIDGNILTPTTGDDIREEIS